ncbi:MAG: hypothetical protein IPN63_05450 [Gammaproteobacteria bacterium]|nr:hypothetical protein [Gammaproteobacteria bacterium]MBK9426870.1 hypothetical protein [Gammaproteobacteria bacterium]
MAAFGRQGDKAFQPIEARIPQLPVSCLIEQRHRRLAHGWRTIRAGTEMHSARAVAAQIEFGERRMIAARKGRLGAAFLLQCGKNELDVFTGAELVGGVIGAGTIVVTRLLAADGHAIGALRLRIADAELRKKRLRANIFQPERLLATELTAQRTLPVKRRKLCRSQSTG